jgi:hypothetical protein
MDMFGGDLGKDIVVFRFIIEYSSLMYLEIIGLFLYEDL